MPHVIDLFNFFWGGGGLGGNKFIEEIEAFDVLE